MVALGYFEACLFFSFKSRVFTLGKSVDILN